jgi:hypothetical protein
MENMEKSDNIEKSGSIGKSCNIESSCSIERTSDNEKSDNFEYSLDFGDASAGADPPSVSEKDGNVLNVFETEAGTDAWLDAKAESEAGTESETEIVAETGLEAKTDVGQAKGSEIETRIGTETETDVQDISEREKTAENTACVSDISGTDSEDQKNISSDSDETGKFSVNTENSGSSGSSGSLEGSENPDNSDNSDPADERGVDSSSMPVPCDQNSGSVNSCDSGGMAVSEYNAQNAVACRGSDAGRVRRGSDVQISDVVEYSEEAVAGAKKSLSVLKLHMYSFFLVCICLVAGFAFLLIFSIHLLSNLYDFLTGMITDAIASFKDFLDLDDYTTDSVKGLARKYGELFNRMRNTGRQILFAVSVLLSVPAVVIGGFSLACASAAGRCIRTFSSADSHGYCELVRRIRIAALINTGSCLAVTLSLLSSWSSLIFLFTFNVTSVITVALIIRYFSVYGAMKSVISGRRLDGPDYILTVIFLGLVVIGLIATDLTVFPVLLILPF